MIIKLRCHHLVCLSNFVGYGYGSVFVENMAKIEKFLKSNLNLNQISLVEGFDDLCSYCPNRFSNSDEAFLNFPTHRIKGCCSFSDSLAKDQAYLELFNYNIGFMFHLGSF